MMRDVAELGYTFHRSSPLIKAWIHLAQDLEIITGLTIRILKQIGHQISIRIDAPEFQLIETETERKAH